MSRIPVSVASKVCPRCGVAAFDAMSADPLYVPEDEPTRGERREARVRNNRKMGVVGRSTLLLGALAAGQQRRRVQRRKRGAQ